MTIATRADRLELAKLPKLINKRKAADLRKYITDRMEDAVKHGGTLEAVKRRVGVGKNRMYALKENQGNVITHRDRVVIVAEEVYADLYSSPDNQNYVEWESSLEEIEIPPVTRKEVRKALKK